MIRLCSLRPPTPQTIKVIQKMTQNCLSGADRKWLQSDWPGQSCRSVLESFWSPFSHFEVTFCHSQKSLLSHFWCTYYLGSLRVSSCMGSVATPISSVRRGDMCLELPQNICDFWTWALPECMYVFMHACMHACMSVYMYDYTYIRDIC